MLLSFRPDGIGTVTVEEKERFEEIKERLRVLLENQITHFRLELCYNCAELMPNRTDEGPNENPICCFHRYCFPFGRPEGALKATLSLLERVGNFYYWTDACKVVFFFLFSFPL